MSDTVSLQGRHPERGFLQPTILVPLFVIYLGTHLILRSIGVFGGPQERLLLVVSFVLLWMSPFVLFSKAGRGAIGFGRFPSPASLLLALGLGAAAAFIVCGLGDLVFGGSPLNWVVTVRTEYDKMPMPEGTPALTTYLMFTLPALLFSPLGEELFFRGVLDESLAQRMGAFISALVTAALFACVHLLHHGALLTGDMSAASLGSSLLWMLMMFLAALTFSFVRRRSGTVWAAVLAHAAFNAAMNAYILFL